MTQYVCNPITVTAWQITEVLPLQENGNRDIVLDSHTLYTVQERKMSRMIPVVGDYLVRAHNPDEYEYLNPKHVFEAKYTRIETQPEE